MTDDILTHYQHVISEYKLVTGTKGAFEFQVNGKMLFSKKKLGRHAEDGEVLRLFEEFIDPSIQRYPRD